MPDEMNVKDKKQDRRCAILEAAAKVFSVRGYAEATCDEIAEAAEVSKGTLYNYFQSKQDLFTQLFLSTMTQEETAFEDALARRATARDKLEAVIEHWYSHFGQYHEMGRLILEFWSTAASEEQGGPFTQALQEIYTRYGDRMTALFKQGQASGEFQLVYGPALAASVVMALFDGMTLHSMMGLGMKVDGDVLTAVKRGMMRALGVDPASIPGETTTAPEEQNND